MPTQLINSFASWVLKQRIHQIELFLKYPNEVQDELLMGLIQSAKIQNWAMNMTMPPYVLMPLSLKEFPSAPMKNFNH
jgi:hypothetical protein